MIWEENKGRPPDHCSRCSPALQLLAGTKRKVTLDFAKQHRAGSMLINADLSLMKARKNYPRMY